MFWFVVVPVLYVVSVIVLLMFNHGAHMKPDAEQPGTPEPRLARVRRLPTFVTPITKPSWWERVLDRLLPGVRPWRRP